MRHADVTFAYFLPTHSMIARLFILALLLIGTAVQAQLGPAGPDPVKWRTEVVPASGWKVGDVVTVHFYATIQAPWHMYSVKPYPAGKYGPLPASYNHFADQSKGIQPLGTLQEEGQPHKEYDDIFEVDTWYFSGSAHYYQQFKVTAADVVVKGRIETQVCKEGTCIPKKHEIALQQTASGASAAPTDSKGDDKADSEKKDKDSTATKAEKKNEVSAASGSDLLVLDNQRPADETDRSSIWAIFLASFAAGLIALITPCVFPLVPMTVSYFTKHAKNRRQGLKDAGIYVVSIIVLFMVPGTLLVSLYGGTIFYDISTNGFVNLLFFVIIFLFALSFLGWFDIKLPSSWSTWADRRSMNNSGAIGIFFMAMTLVIASFSCTGPLLGGVLTSLSTGGNGTLDAVVGLGGFALGFAIPFGILALFPGMLSHLPSSGGWLNTVKVVLGFVELMLCMKFFSQADQLWHWGILDREVFLAIWIVLAFALGAYLMGWYRLPHDHQPVDKVPVPRLLIALAVFGFAMTLLPGMWGAPMANLSGILPPPNREVGVKISDYYADDFRNNRAAAADTFAFGTTNVCELKRKDADKHVHNAPSGYCMFYDFDEGMAFARKVGKPVMIDFTGFTCANCRQMEQKVWSDPAVKKLITENYVLISLYVDDATRLPQPLTAPDGSSMRTIGDKWTQFQLQHYRLLAQPYYAVVLPDMQDGRLVNLTWPKAYDSDKEAYAAWLQRGLDIYRKHKK